MKRRWTSGTPARAGTWRVRALSAMTAGALVLGGTTAGATDYLQDALKVILKNNAAAGKQKAVWVSKTPAPVLPTADPQAVGGTFEVINPTTGESASFDLPAASWGTNGANTLYKFVNKEAPAGPSEVKVALVKAGSVMKTVAKATGITLDEATQGTIGVVLTIGGDRYCSTCTTPKKDEPDKYIAKGCTAPARCAGCGDTILQPARGEECDDGNTVPGDGCRADCTSEECGDGIPDAGEQCDDGNAGVGDGCRPDCTSEVCGDGIQDPQEQCDDGNTVSGDGCNALCESEGVTCSPASAGRTVRVDIDTPVSLAGIRVDLEYPQAHTSIPGMGNSSLVQGRVTILQAGGQSVVNDRDTDLTVVLANATAFITSGPLYEIDFDQCTALAANMCNRNQNVIGCCNDVGDPNQFGDFCQQRECSNLPGTVCTVATEVAVCGGAGLCVQRPCVSDASCTPTLGTCVGKCPANPPVCPTGTFPTGGTVGPCTTVAGGCPGDNACVTQTASTICTVTDPVDDMGNPVDGVTCSVTITEVP